MNKKGDYLMFKKLLCGVVAMTMALGLASCDKTQEEKKVSGDEVLGLVMNDVITWDFTKGIEIDGDVSTKLGNYTKTGDFNVKLAMDAVTGGMIAQIQMNDLMGSDFEAYIDETVSYIHIGEIKMVVPASSTSSPVYPASDPSTSDSEDVISNFIAQFDFYQLSETKYYMTAKKEFLTSLNLQIESYLSTTIPFLGVELKELRVDLGLTNQQKLNHVSVKVGAGISIDDETLNCEFKGSVSLNKNAMPTKPSDTSNYVTAEVLMQQLLQNPLTGSLELNAKLGDLEVTIAVDVSFVYDMQTGYPTITIDINEKTTIDIMELLGVPDVTLKKMVIAYDEESLGLALSLYDAEDNLIVKLPFTSSSDTPSDTPLASSGSETQQPTPTIDMVLLKEILKAVLFDFTIVEEEGKIEVTFNSQLWNVLTNYVQEALETSFGGSLEQVIQQLMAENEAIKEQNPSGYEQDANYQNNLQYIQLLTLANQILSIESAKIVIAVEYEANSTTLMLSVESASDFITLTIHVDVSFMMLTMTSVGFAMWIVGSSGPTNPAPSLVALA